MDQLTLEIELKRGGASMSTNGKPKFAMYWAASCGGCEIAVLNIGEKILDVDANFEVVFWPVAMDAKYKDVEAMPDGSILLTLFNGGIRNSGKRRNCPPAAAEIPDPGRLWLVRLRRLHPRSGKPFACPRGSLDTAFESSHNRKPRSHLDRLPSFANAGRRNPYPEFYPVLRTLDQVVDVDYYMPGCPPESHQIAAVIDLVIQVLHGEASLPPKGSVIGAGDLHRLR